MGASLDWPSDYQWAACNHSKDGIISEQQNIA